MATARNPSVISASAPPLAGGNDLSLSRYMSELASYDLLSRDDEIVLSEAVERLEIAYWGVLLSSPRVFATVRDAICRTLAPPPTELRALARLQKAASRSRAPRAVRARFERAACRLAVQLRAQDIHRDAVKAAHAAVEHQILDARGTPTQTASRYLAACDAARRAQQEAKDKFVAANLRLVVSMARRYARSERMPLSDLIQEGNLGLMKAVERFDHRRGFRFSTYASWWIRHALTRGLADKGRVVRFPVHALEARARVAKATRKLASTSGEAPNLAQLAEQTGLSQEKVRAARALVADAHVSLDAPVGNDTERTFLELLRYENDASAEDVMSEGLRADRVRALMGELSPFEAQILRYRFGFDGGDERTLKEIGDMYNLSRERIRQIEALALQKMRARVRRDEHAA